VALLFFASAVTQSMAQAPWTNVALDKPALQTTTAGFQVAGLAVDGNIVGNIVGDTCSRTQTRRNASAWWGVDLIRRFEIRRVIITLPADVDTLNGASVLVGSSIANLTACTTLGNLTRGGQRQLSIRCRATNVRFVSLFRASGGVIALCDVNVQGRRMDNRTEARLLSLNATVFMSPADRPGFGGRRSVDGNVNQDPAGGSCSMTQNVEGAFFTIALGRRSRVDRVVVYAMRTRRGRRPPLRSYVIELSNDGLTGWRECETHFGVAAPGSITSMPCGDRRSARFVRLRVRSVGRLAFCEVNVYGWRLPRRRV